MLRFLVPLFPYASLYYKPVFYCICCVSIFFSSAAALRQIDLKRIIAYSSVAHMNFALLGIASLTFYGIEGSIFLMLGHGLISAALFLLVGALYDRYHVRSVKYYAGLTAVMPIYSFFFFFFSLANFSLPGTCNFIGELLVIVGLMKTNFLLCLFATTSIFFSAAFSVWTCNKVIFGSLSGRFLLIYTDLIRRETTYLLVLLGATLFFGLFPTPLLEYLCVFVHMLVL